MGRTLRLPIARAYTPLLQPSRYKGAYGGRGSAKSHEFATLLLEKYLIDPTTRWVCVREIQKSLDQSVKLLIEDKIKAYDIGSHFIVKHTEIITPQGGVMTFQGMQDHTSSSIKSLEGYDGVWVEEAQTLSERSLTMLRPTIRKEKCCYCFVEKSIADLEPCKVNPAGHKIEPSELWFSWNPDDPKDPVDKLLRTDKPPDSIVVATSFRDNPWFPAVLRQEMEWDLRIDADKYQHVWEGAYQKRSNARVFKNWRIEDFVAPESTVWHVGADWGFSIDPSTLVRAYEQRINPETGQPWERKRLYIDRECYQVGVEIDYLPALFDGLVCGCQIDQNGKRIGECLNPKYHGWARSQAIIADSARPETISYLRRFGYGGIEAAKKGPNSVKEGVMFLQGYDVIIHSRCKHSIYEWMNYSYVVDKKTGEVTNVLEDKKNHVIDPVRYAVEQLRGALQIRRAVWG